MRGMFTKYMSAFAAILIFSFLMLLYIVSSLLNSTNYDAMCDSLRSSFIAGKEIVYAYYHNDGEDQSLKIKLDEHLRALCAGSENEFFLFDPDGEIIISTRTDRGSGRGFNPNIFGNKPETEDVTGPGDLEGFFLREYYYMYTTFKENDTVSAVLMVYNPVYIANGVSDATVGSLITAALWIIVVSLLVVYFITERIVGPLHEISTAARVYASGDFMPRVKVEGDDEISDVAKAFNEMADTLQRLEQMRSSFLANVSHDLRTPMTTIGGFVDGILDGTIPPEKQSYYLGIVSQEVRRLSRLVSTLMDISKLESGQAQLRYSEFNLSETARRALISCESRIDGKKLEIVFNNDHDLIVGGDEDAIHKVIYNLLDNAIKFSDAGGVISIDITSVESGKARKARFTIKNGGAGIPPDELPFLFERFYKSDRSRGLDKTGTGLGLYICKQTVVAHGEEISVSSDENGTVFSFNLPLIGKRTKN